MWEHKCVGKPHTDQKRIKKEKEVLFPKKDTKVKIKIKVI